MDGPGIASCARSEAVFDVQTTTSEHGKGTQLMSQTGQNGEQSVAQAADIDTLLLGTSPSYSQAVLDAVLAQAIGMAMFNAASAQQEASLARRATVLMACTTLLSLGVSGVPGSAAQSALEAATSEKPSKGAATTSDPPPPPLAAIASPPANASAEEGEQSNVNARIVAAIEQTQQAVLSAQVVRTSGAGKAYQLAAQSAAIAIQDATEALRSMSTITTTAASVAMANFLATGDEKYLRGISAARDMMATATDDFAAVAAFAIKVMTDFPSN